jgi:hypothetical protein
MPPVPEQNLIAVNQIRDSARRVIHMEDKAWPRTVRGARALWRTTLATRWTWRHSTMAMSKKSRLRKKSNGLMSNSAFPRCTTTSVA